MTTFDVAAAAWRAGRVAAKQAKAEARARRTARAIEHTRSIARQALRTTLTLGAFAAVTLAAWGVDYKLGLFVGALSALYLEWLLGSSE